MKIKCLALVKFKNNSCRSAIVHWAFNAQTKLLSSCSIIPNSMDSSHPFAKTLKPQPLSGSLLTKKICAVSGILLLQSVFVAPVQAANAEKIGQRVLMIEMTPALCSLQPSRARMRQCLEGYSFTISGLDLGYGRSCGQVSEPRITPLQLKVVNRVMPDNTVRSQVWQRYGACSPLSANNYFRQIINYAGQLKMPSELNSGNNYSVSKSRFIKQMTSLNSGMSSSSIDLICQAGNRRQSTLTGIHVCYEGDKYATCNSTVNSCGRNFVIAGSQ